MQLAMRYSGAWASHDPDAILALHTEDTVFHIHGGEAPHEGADAVRAAIAEIFATSPDLAFAPRRAHFGDDHFVSEYVVSGTAGGNAFAVDGVDVFTLRDGRVARKDTYLDLPAYLAQTAPEVPAAV